MDKLKMHTVNKADENFRKLSEMFPNAITETINENGEVERAIDKDILMQEISCKVVEGNEQRYQFTWPDKKKALALANVPIADTLRPCIEKSVGKEGVKGKFDSENIYIEGDNLEALKILQEVYTGKIKMIYIDPPYNTGNDSFLYNDCFDMNKENFLNAGGYYDQEGNWVFDFTENNELYGRFHTEWLNMMYTRLKVAKNLLTDDGILFVSIDDNELNNLKKICDEIFGESNYINTISLFTKVSAGASGGGEDKKLKKNMEYILFYAKNSDKLGPLPAIYKKTKMIDYIEQMKKDGKSFKYTNVLYKCNDKEYYKTIKDGSGGDIEIYKVNDYEIKTVKQISNIENISEEEVYNKYYDKIMTTTNAQTSIRDRVWKATDSENNMYIASYVPVSGKNKGKKTDLIFMGKQKVLVVWLKDTAEFEDGVLYKKEKIGTYWDGFSWINVTKEGNVKFDNGKKPVSLIQQLLHLVSDRDNIYVLDFFSGSATTAHAVLKENAEFNSNIKFILVQFPEKIKATTKKNKEYIKYLSEQNIEPYVNEIGKERICRAGNKIKEETNADMDYGFRVFKCDSSNMKDVYYKPEEYQQSLFSDLVDNIKDDRTPEDLLFQVMIELGIELSANIEEKTVKGKKYFDVSDGYLIACFDADITGDIITEIAKKHPYYFVMRDSSLANDNIATNFEQIFKTYSSDTVRKVL